MNYLIIPTRSSAYKPRQHVWPHYSLQWKIEYLTTVNGSSNVKNQRMCVFKVKNIFVCNALGVFDNTG